MHINVTDSNVSDLPMTSLLSLSNPTWDSAEYTSSPLSDVTDRLTNESEGVSTDSYVPAMDMHEMMNWIIVTAVLCGLVIILWIINLVIFDGVTVRPCVRRRCHCKEERSGDRKEDTRGKN